MKRVWICGGILLLTVAVSVATLLYLRWACGVFTAQIDRVMTSYESGGEQTEQQLEQLEQYWEKYSGRLALGVNTAELNDISCSVSRLDTLFDAHSEEFISECISTRKRVELIYKGQIPFFSVL